MEYVLLLFICPYMTLYHYGLFLFSIFYVHKMFEMLKFGIVVLCTIITCYSNLFTYLYLIIYNSIVSYIFIILFFML